MSRIKDTDYLFISARIRAMETNLLTHERMERMLDARSDDEAFKVLAECGYGEPSAPSAEALSELLSAHRVSVFKEISSLAPDPDIVEVFKLKYDYHNAKTLIKCEATGADAERLIIDAGMVDVKTLTDAFRQSDYRGLPDRLRAAIADAREVIASTGDPQLADFVLDRAYYEDMQAASKESGSAFLKGYTALLIDGANLRSAVRTARMNKGADFLRRVLVPGGNVDVSTVVAAVFSGGSLESAFTGRLSAAAEAGAQCLKGGRLTYFEKLCDDALTAYLKESRFVPFGESVLVAYLAAKESEITAARIIMAGKLAGVSTESIRERLRESYV